MQIRMFPEETALFTSFIRNATSYVEFGTGGSTVLASNYVRDRIISVDSSQEWLDLVKVACADSKVIPELLFMDIGTTGEWGSPTDNTTRHRWPSYHSDVWNVEGSANADLYLVDGRFRVACFAQVVLHCKPSAIIAIHDFSSRPAYHRVNEIAREIATAGDLSFFLPLPEREKAHLLLRDFSFEPF
ncbi:hypothetical protein LPW26_12805 [Rhodopseudomonas sp. HC1]|uniref:hypothetical protein n=1 Tax=Rhodopseudomonas infernalis TaxID=2897386 RepID=UPI001EE84268|nr:hypothetical protein [Rhodopseudomonas infernalis]MCG6205523.1 hypothetical protein [Rhodopseudomonas infernalis]